MKIKRSACLIVIGFVAAIPVYCQPEKSSHAHFVDLAVTFGSSRGSVVAAYVYNLRSPKHKLGIGLGLRSTNAWGKKQEFITAPAKLARTNATPFLVVLAGQNTANWDTLTVQRAFTSSLNFTANLHYAFTPRFSAGLNIDIVGFTVGKTSPAILLSNGKTTTEANAKPAKLNALLTGDLDYGNLNSEFFLKYAINNRWSVRAIYQFLFTEYKTSAIHQVAPDGTMVDRFRSKSNNAGIGISCIL